MTAQLAALATVLLFVVTPPAWGLARTKSRFKPLWASVAALPLVPPPSVLGSCLLLLMGPAGVDRFFCCDFLVFCEEVQCMTPA